MIDVDVTEYLTVRVSARHDNVPVGEGVKIVYGCHENELLLNQGAGECRLPWLEGVECNVSLRGLMQARPLDKDIVNAFNFEFVTPVTPRTPVTVRVHADGAPVVNEPVTIVYRDNVLQMNTDGNGEAKTEFDTPDDSEGLRWWLRPVRDRQSGCELGSEPW